MAQSVFEQLGGFAAVSGIVMAFYDKVLDSDEVGDFFDGIDMNRMIDHQTKFVSSLLGGPASYTDEQLKASHRHLNINESQFAEVCRLLDETLVDNGIDAEKRQYIAEQFQKRKAVIVTA